MLRNKYVTYGVQFILVVLLIATIRGCHKSRKDASNIKALMDLTDSSIAIANRAVNDWAEAKKKYKDTLEFERGQRALAEAQKERTEVELDESRKENKALINKYKYHQYADTNMVSAPKELLDDCKDCFTRLEITDGLTLKYKKEVNEWGLRLKRETSVLENRTKEVEKERDNYFHQVDSLNKIQKQKVSKMEPHGRFYLSWGVLWRPWPVGVGGGFMYQNKRNLILGLKGYYGLGGTTVETNVNFPLSLKFK